MEQEQTRDPSGTYDADEVSLAADGVPITKGDGAAGVFLEIGRDGIHFKTKTGADGSLVRSRIIDPKRPMSITLQRSAKGNAVLRNIKQTGHVARLQVERRRDGAVLLSAQVLMVDDDSPRDFGHDELRWKLTVVG